jgi:hypothetical protein
MACFGVGQVLKKFWIFLELFQGQWQERGHELIWVGVYKATLNRVGAPWWRSSTTGGWRVLTTDLTGENQVRSASLKGSDSMAFSPGVFCGLGAFGMGTKADHWHSRSVSDAHLPGDYGIGMPISGHSVGR